MVALKAKYSGLLASAIMMFAVVFGFAQQPKARLAGLERNEEYMSLLRDDAELANKIDSLTAAVYNLREVLYRDDGSRKERSTELLNMESELYMLRGDRSRLVEKINAIEQEWLLANISSGTPSEDVAEDKQPVLSGRQYPDLVRNEYFSRSLSQSDYSMLVRAQRDEKLAARLFSDFARAHGELADVRVQYDSVVAEADADSLLSMLLSKQSVCTALSDSLDTIWSNTFDNKSYLYDLLLDKNEREDMLDKAEQNLFAMRQGVARENGKYASDAVVNYCFGKRYILDYEIDIARSVGLSMAQDSLMKVRASLDKILHYDFAKIALRKRIFIEYAPMVFSSRYVYNSKNPVPECPVYEYGTVYRIKLGEFATQQPTSKFKGLEPVSYLRTPAGGWIYYGGCYRSLDELENALKTVKRLGFTKADVAAWSDGAYAGNRVEVEMLMSKKYSIEISGSDDLSANVRDIIADDEGNTGVTRTGRGVFTVGGLKSRDSAEALANAIAAADSSLSVVVVELDIAK